jgi:hypothetical protein
LREQLLKSLLPVKGGFIWRNRISVRKSARTHPALDQRNSRWTSATRAGSAQPALDQRNLRWISATCAESAQPALNQRNLR